MPKLAKSDIYLALHIYQYAVHTLRLLEALTYTEVVLWAKLLYSQFSQYSGHVSGLIVCRGL